MESGTLSLYSTMAHQALNGIPGFLNEAHKMFPNKLLVSVILASATFAAPALAEDVQYQIVNNSALTLMEFYTSPADSGSWDEDILGSAVLASGETGTVTIADGSTQCAYDLRFVMEDGQELTDQVDVCAMASYTLQ
jgi:hypothetical protein